MRRSHGYLAAVLVGLLPAPSCDEGPTAGPDTPIPSTYDRISTGLLTPSCAIAACHAGATPTGGLALTPERAYGALVGVIPANEAARTDGLLRVRRGSPEQSFLMRKLTGTLGSGHGARMPLGSSALHPAMIEYVRQWIAAGAPRDGDVADTSLLHGAHGHGAHDFEALAPPSHGFQLHLPAFDVRPHSEREVFFATRSPIAHATYMTGFRVAMRDLSHHFTLYSLLPGGAPLALNVVRDRGFNNDEFLRPRAFLFGTQEADVSYSLPPGVGIRLDPNDPFDVNVHAVNPGATTLPGEAYVNVFTAEHVERVATPLLWSFHRFVLPAHSSRTLRDTLQITDASDLLMLTTHFHKHGRLFRIYHLHGGVDEVIYENRLWDHPLIARYDASIHLAAGDRLRLEATYTNDTDVDIYYGASAEDEMCSIYGLVVEAG
jgi:hypothetical protein